MNLVSILFKNISEKQKLIKNTFWIFVGRFLGYLFRGFSFIFSARFLGPQLYGAFSSIYSLSSILQSFSDFGITTILTKKVSEEQEKKEEYFWGAFFLWLIFGAVLLLIGLKIFKIFIKSEINFSDKIYIFIFLALMFDLLREIGNSFIRGLEKMEIQGIFHILVNFLSFIFVFFILRKSPNLKVLSQIYFFTFLLGAVCVLYFVFRNFSKLKIKIKKEILKKIFSESWALGLANVLFFFNFNLTTLFLSFFHKSQEVGIFSVALRFYEVLVFFPSSLAMAIFPIISREKDKTEKFIEFGLKFSYFLIFPFILGGIILGSDIINFLFGIKYQESYFPFLILLLAFIFNSFLFFIVNSLISLGKRKELLIFDFINTFIVLVFSLILIPSLGALGAAIAHSANSVFVFFFAKKIAQKYLKFKIFKFDYIKELTLGSIFLGLILLALKILNVNVVINILIGALIYLSLTKKSLISLLRND